MKQTTFVVPTEIRWLLGPAPVLAREDAKRFEKILNHFARCFQPKNGLEWFHVWDLTVARWKLERLTRYENQVEQAAHRKVVEEAERASAKQAEEEHNMRELDRRLAEFPRVTSCEGC